jgi:hypothetical protein
MAPPRSAVFTRAAKIQNEVIEKVHPLLSERAFSGLRDGQGPCGTQHGDEKPAGASVGIKDFLNLGQQLHHDSSRAQHTTERAEPDGAMLPSQCAKGESRLKQREGRGFRVSQAVELSHRQCVAFAEREPAHQRGS